MANAFKDEFIRLIRLYRQENKIGHLWAGLLHLNGRIGRYFSNRLSDAAKADDLTHDFLIELVHTHRDKFDPDRDPEALVYKMAHDFLFDYFRRNGRDAKRFVALADDFDTQGDVPDAFFLAQDAAFVRKEIAALKQEDRNLLDCLYVEGMTYEEAAAALGRSHKSVKDRRTKLTKILRTRLKPLRPDDQEAP